MTTENTEIHPDDEGFTVRTMGDKRVAKTGETRPVSNADKDPFKEMYGPEGEGVIEPPYDLDWLSKAHEYNSILGPCLDSMSLNTVGFGWRLEATVDLDAIEEGPEKEKLKVAMEAEKKQLESFFNYCHTDDNYTILAQKRAFDKHLTGNGFWEIVRYGNGKPAGVEHIPAYTVRLTLADKEFTTYKTLVKVSDTEYEERMVRKRFRRYVQIVEERKTYFKEFGDPRTLDANTGKWLTVTDPATGALAYAQGETKETVLAARRATELLHFAHYCPYSPYGVPKWMGNVLSVTGSRAYEEINENFADNKAIPPLAILVSGGKLSNNSVERIQQHIDRHIKGRDNYHQALILETDSKPDPNMPGQTQRGSIQIQPLTTAVQSDEIFAKYDDRARNKIRAAFRLPPIYSGDSQDYTRATAEESASVAEKQVFSPERLAEDHVINRRLMTALGARYWTFVSNSSVENSPVDQANLYVQIRTELTVNEARAMIAKITNTEIPALEDEWAKTTPIGQLQLMVQTAEAKEARENGLKQAELIAQGKGDQITDPGSEGKEKEEAPENPEDEQAQVKKSAAHIHAVSKELEALREAEYLLGIEKEVA